MQLAENKYILKIYDSSSNVQDIPGRIYEANFLSISWLYW